MHVYVWVLVSLLAAAAHSLTNTCRAVSLCAPCSPPPRQLHTSTNNGASTFLLSLFVRLADWKCAHCASAHSSSSRNVHSRSALLIHSYFKSLTHQLIAPFGWWMRRLHGLTCNVVCFLHVRVVVVVVVVVVVPLLKICNVLSTSVGNKFIFCCWHLVVAMLIARTDTATHTNTYKHTAEVFTSNKQ